MRGRCGVRIVDLGCGRVVVWADFSYFLSTRMGRPLNCVFEVAEVITRRIRVGAGATVFRASDAV